MVPQMHSLASIKLTVAGTRPWAMRAIVCKGAGGPEVLSVGTVPDPTPKPGEILIAVKATAVNGADASQRAGAYPPPAGASEILGLEAAGEVVQLGEGAHKFRIGDRVMALLDGGGYAEKATCAEGNAMPLPAGFSWEQGAAIPETWLTAYMELIMLGKLQPGGSLLIHAGASGVGSAAIQIAKAVGAEVFVTASSQDKLNYCKALGATHGINYKTEDFVEVITQHTTAAKLSGVPGGAKSIPGVDVILDLVGASHFANNIKALTLEGKLLLVGLPSGTKAEIDLAQVLVKRLQIIGSTLRARSVAAKADVVSQFSSFALDKFASGKFKAQVDTTFPLAEARKAHERMAAAQNMGKLVLTV